MPKQFRQNFRSLNSGQKRRRIGGAMRLTGARPRLIQLRGQYSPSPPTIEDSRPWVRQDPLTREAWDLLVRYHQYNAFHRLIESGATVPDAGKAILGVSRSASFKVRREIRRHEDDPSEWFATKALEGIGRCEIRWGRATKPSARADAFFEVLGDGEHGKAYWRGELESLPRIDLARLEKQRMAVEPDWSEALDYWLYAGQLWK